MELTDWQLCALVNVYYDTVSGGMYQVYYPNSQPRICAAVRELRDQGLVVITPLPMRDPFQFQALITAEGEKVLKSYSASRVIYALDYCGWYVTAGDYIGDLPIADLSEFIVHEYDYYRAKALERYTELVHEGLQQWN